MQSNTEGASVSIFEFIVFQHPSSWKLMYFMLLLVLGTLERWASTCCLPQASKREGLLATIPFDLPERIMPGPQSYTPNNDWQLIYLVFGIRAEGCEKLVILLAGELSPRDMPVWKKNTRINRSENIFNCDKPRFSSKLLKFA